MRALKGTGRLVRLALRRDRMKLPVWIISILLLGAVTASSIEATYGQGEAERLSYATTMAPSAVGRMFGGAISGPSIGEIIVIESFLWVGLGVILMNIFLVVRHTRQHEEQGQAELIGAMQVGRQSALTAALLTALGANFIVGALLASTFIALGFETTGALAYSVGITLLGCMFAVIAAVTSQLSENTRGASGLAGAFLGGAFLVRAIGDALGTVGADGVSVTSSWLSWLSPIGWIQQVRPFGDERWWVLALCVGFILAGVALAYGLLARRDIGSGILTSKSGQANARASLLRPLGLIWRLHHVAFIAWLVGIIIMGASVGGAAPEFENMIAENPQIQEILQSMGGSGDFTGILFGSTFALGAITLGAFTVQSVLRTRHEEAEGRAEAVLATPLSRVRWLLRYVIYTTLTTTVLLASLGASTGLVFGLIEGDVLYWTHELTEATLVYVPAVLALGGLAMFLVGIIPRFAVALSWTAFTIVLLVAQFGALLKLPTWVMNISPFVHTPTLPAASFSLTPLVIQAVAALLLLVLGLVAFRSRDLSTS